jgi:hypothetical protein
MHETLDSLPRQIQDLFIAMHLVNILIFALYRRIAITHALLNASIFIYEIDF